MKYSNFSPYISLHLSLRCHSISMIIIIIVIIGLKQVLRCWLVGWLVEVLSLVGGGGGSNPIEGLCIPALCINGQINLINHND